MVASAAMARRPFLEALLGKRICLPEWHPFPASRGFSGRRSAAADVEAVAGWGNKRSGTRAAQLAHRHGVPHWRLEDGFLRSADDGTDPAGLSLCVDEIGIYYDARHPSRLEQLIAAGCPDAAQPRCDALIDAWRHHRLSKYNHARDAIAPFPGGHILVCDQTRGDCSIDGALCAATDFARMLEAALDEHPGHAVILKTHPDVFSGRKQGHFAALSPGATSRIQVLASHHHAPDLIEHAHALYTVSSQMGFEALLWDRPVHAFGMPFYAGWGLTRDALAAPVRRSRATRADLVHAALLAYPRYVDPETGRRCEIERVIEHIALQRRMRARFPRTIHAIGFSRWKRPIARAFFSGSELRFIRRACQLPDDAQAVATWGLGSKPLPEATRALPWIRVEDGFVRSVGLGARLVRPLSWALDGGGLYYDAQGPSGLTALLEAGRFDAALLARARALAATLVEQRLSKYNLAGVAWHRPPGLARVLLVVGQVEGDASLERGSRAIATNLALLERVRAGEPDAYIAYKPHPDVAAGLRPGAIPTHVAARLCDAVLNDTPVIDVLKQVDAVHVMTSLTGFEALLHGRPVVTHGRPFYAGWGLTVDRDPADALTEPRGRAVSLEELVAAALILYPTYLSATTGQFTTPERALIELVEMREGRRPVPTRARYWPEWLLRRAARKGPKEK